MEKQDPGLRSACYVAQKYLEDYISFARQDLADCLSSYKACNEKKNALVRALMKKHRVLGTLALQSKTS